MTEKFVICFDPESYQIFSFGLTTQLLVLELDVPLEIRQKAIQTIKDIRNLLHCKSTIWSIQSKEAWAFRRRLLPKYLVNKDTNPYPRILQMTELSSAFSEATNLELVVDLNQYAHLKSEGAIKVNCPQQIQVVVPLATG